jgi:hypothetical protein
VIVFGVEFTVTSMLVLFKLDNLFLQRKISGLEPGKYDGVYDMTLTASTISISDTGIIV